jgi:hypothetical protein
MQRRRSPAHSFEGRIAAEKAKLEEQAATLPPGPDKNRLLGKIRQLEAAASMNNWLSLQNLSSSCKSLGEEDESTVLARQGRYPLR